MDRETTMDREQHLERCKKRALKYVDAGDLENAFASFASDVTKHEETAPTASLVQSLGMVLLINGHLNTPEKMRHHIEGYN